MLLLWVLAVAACAHGSAKGPPPSASPLLDEPTPIFQRVTLQGKVYDSDDAHTRARLLVVQFFAAYCQPCQGSLPALEALRATRPEIEVVGVSMDDNLDAAIRMLNRHRLTFPVIHDADHTLGARFRVTDVPTTFLADATGRIVWAGGPEQPADAVPKAIAAFAAPAH
jgi:peroxiredoxin